MSEPEAAPDPPISVTASAAKVVSRETFKTLFVAGFAVLASQLVHSDVALVAVIPAGGLLGVWLYGVYERVYHWKVAKYLAGMVDDTIAKVGK